MGGDLIADRFVCEKNDRWIDLVTDARLAVLPAMTGRAEGELQEVSSAVRRVVRQITEIANAVRVGIRLEEMTLGCDVGAVAIEAARAVRAMGFVTVRSTVRLDPALTDRLLSRHTVVVCWREEEREAAVWWVRRLSHRSPRGHLVVVLAEVRPSLVVPRREGLSSSGCISVARERPSGVCGAPLRGQDVTDAREARLERADTSLRAGRAAAAGRWLTAAVAAATRRQDEPTMAEAGRKLVDLALARGDFGRVVASGRPLLDAIDDLSRRAPIVAAVASAFIATGELARAEALLTGVQAEAKLRRAPLPPLIETRYREVCFWSGRFDEAAATDLATASSDPERLAWVGLIAWARGETAVLATCLASITDALNVTDRRNGTRFWAAALAALAPPGSDDDDDVDGRVATLLEAARSVAAPRPVHLLARALAAELSLSGGRPARSLLERRGAQPAPLDELLLDWLHAKSERDAAALPPLLARIRRLGAEGITRWGMGATSMHFVRGLPALMQLVQDADDELAALMGGCTWVRRHAGADRVGIVDAERTQLIAADGWTPADLTRGELAGTACPVAAGAAPETWVMLTAPIRYGRVVIGHVMARGRMEIRASLDQAITTLAALSAPALRTRLDALALARDAHARAPEILGRSVAIASVREAIGRAAATTFPVLIDGESGTGKELVARALHRLSPRRARPFSAINCAALTDDLLEAELFGHARGAFTGAIGERVGLFEQAHSGTLLLDEVSELSSRAQAKLLRVLQEREIRRLGENTARPVDVRIVAATNRPLGEAAGRGLFREDLLFRLAVVRIYIPPLRDRVEDVPLLAQAFWRQMLIDTGKRAILGPDALASLCRHDWPGNVRELQNVMAALAVVAPAHGRIAQRHVSQVLSAPAPACDVMGVPLRPLRLETAKRLFEQRMIAAALARNGGRRTATAHELGLTRQGLTKALRRLGLAVGQDAAGVA